MTIPLLTLRQIPPVFRLARLGLLLAAGLVQLACQTGAPGPPAAAAPSPERAEPPLVPGAPVERRLETGGSREELLRLEADWYLLLTVRQKGIDVAVSLLDPNGREIAAADDPEGRVRPERLAVSTKVSGEYLLRIVPHDPEAPEGTYELEIRELRPAGPGDEERVAAEKELAEGRRLQNVGDGESKRQAVVRLEEALRLWRKAGDLRGQVRALNEMADVAEKKPDKVRYCEEAIRLSRESGDEEGLAAAFNRLGDAYSSDERARAIEQYEQALVLWHKLADRAQEGRTLYRLGLMHLQQGEPGPALDLLNQGLVFLREVDDGATEVDTLVAIYGAHATRGEIGQAMEVIQQALELSARLDRPDSEALVLYNLAFIQRLRGEPEDALRSLEGSLRLNRQAENRDNMAACLQGLGSVYYDLGDLERARGYTEQARALNERLERKDRAARALNNIGWILYRQGKLEEALGSSSQALEISRTLADISLTAATLHNVGIMKVALGEMQGGLEALSEALSLRRTKGSLFEQAQTLREIGAAYHRLGDPERAGASFGESLDFSRRIGSPGLEAEGLFRWALLDRGQGRLEDALDKIEQALRLVESMRSGVTVEEFSTSFFASKRPYYELYVDLLMRLHALDPEGGFAAKALAASERARARGLLDLLAGKVDLRQGIDPTLKQQETELGSRLTWIQNRIQNRLGKQTAPGSEEAEALQRQLSQTRKELEQIQEEIRQRFPQYAEIRYPMPLDLAGIHALLKDDRTAFLEYFVARDASNGSYLFVVTREGLTSYPLRPAAELREQVRSLRELLVKPNSLQILLFRQRALGLYRDLVAPAADVLKNKPYLLISQDGPLQILPFEVLLTDDRTGARRFSELPFLLADHAIAYVPSAGVLADLARRESIPLEASKAFVGFADPVSGGNGGTEATRAILPGAPEDRELPPLPGAALEVEAIAKLYPQDEVTLYIGDLATEENVKDNAILKSTRRIHFATHGLVNESQPEQSSLVLTRRPGSKEDGRLQVAEIFNLELGADLLVLSACDTGRGKEVSGEGLVGLTRAFLYAGAHSLVVSLWPVQDTTTPELMVGFYSRLGAAESKADALKQAKLKMIRDGRAHPYYWAPFVLVGASQ